MALSEDLNYLMDSLSCVTYNGAQHSLIQIEEKDPSAKLKKVNLNAGNGNWFCFNPDEGRKCSHLRRNSNLVLMSPLLKVDSRFDHHCACDAVIFICEGDNLIVVYIDLKSGNPTGYSSQFKSTRQFVRYLLSLSEEFAGRKISIYEERYIIFYGGENRPLLNKKTTIPKSNVRQSLPDNAYKREVKNDSTLYLRELLA
ncbi:hypothetical protein [Neisseria dentiae]|uniref:hypothetical protein n=1 Tax=Neisseria dentiae TaxID=194197 RepID=UPI0035A02BC8